MCCKMFCFFFFVIWYCFHLNIRVSTARKISVSVHLNIKHLCTSKVSKEKMHTNCISAYLYLQLKLTNNMFCVLCRHTVSGFSSGVYYMKNFSFFYSKNVNLSVVLNVWYNIAEQFEMQKADYLLMFYSLLEKRKCI